MGKKIEGLKKVGVTQRYSGKVISYEYRGVSIKRYYQQGTVGRVGVYRGSVGYQTAGFFNEFNVTTWNEVKDFANSFSYRAETLQRATEAIDNMIDNQNAVVIKGRLYRNFSEEQLVKRGLK